MVDLKPLDINVSNFIDSYRNIGYTIETAIADIIDNSIFANSKNINVRMVWKDYEKDTPFVQIIDDGIGMDDAELTESMRLACKSPSCYREPTDLGRFGLGLKSASFSQCKILTVGSRKEGNEPCAKQWNVSLIRKENRFLLNHCTIEESGLSDLIPSPHGTIVQWTELDSLNIPSNASSEKKKAFWKQIVTKVYDHISKIFGSFKGQIKFFFNGNEISLWDPFLISNDETRIIADENISLGKSNIHLRSYILPKDLASLELAELTKESNLNDLQGFYIYRNNRLIVSGSWLNLKGLSKKESFRLAHIRLDIDNTMDEMWHIDIKKEVAVCPPELQDKLLAYAKQARAESSKVFRIRKKYLKRHQLGETKFDFIWDHGTFEGKHFYYINRENPIINSFCDNLEGEQKESFLRILKFIETHVPVRSIIDAESNSKSSMDDNEYNRITTEDIIIAFENTLNNILNKGIDYDDAVKSIIYTEPFFSKYDEISEYLKDKEN